MQVQHNIVIKNPTKKILDLMAQIAKDKAAKQAALPIEVVSEGIILDHDVVERKAHSAVHNDDRSLQSMRLGTPLRCNPLLL